jgi:serine/threonine protein kinase
VKVMPIELDQRFTVKEALTQSHHAAKCLLAYDEEAKGAREAKLRFLKCLSLDGLSAAEQELVRNRFAWERRAYEHLSSQRGVRAGSFSGFPYLHLVGRFGGAECLVLEYIDGPNLRQLTESAEHEWTRDTIWSFLFDMLTTLQILHNAGGLHLDIKPDNIMVRRDIANVATYVLVDFGAFRITQNGHYLYTEADPVIGTRGYQPPEQSPGGRLLASSDLYALGRTVLYLVSQTAVRNSEIREQLKPIEQFCRRMCDDVPSKRYANATSALDALKIKDRSTHASERTQFSSDFPRVPSTPPLEEAHSAVPRPAIKDNRLRPVDIAPFPQTIKREHVDKPASLDPTVKMVLMTMLGIIILLFAALVVFAAWFFASRSTSTSTSSSDQAPEASEYSGPLWRGNPSSDSSPPDHKSYPDVPNRMEENTGEEQDDTAPLPADNGSTSDDEEDVPLDPDNEEEVFPGPNDPFLDVEG